MTVHYLNDVLTSKPGVFLKLLLRWKGGIHKLLFVELFIFLGLFYAINIFLQFFSNKSLFIKTVDKLFQFQSRIPIILLLGFYIYSVYLNFIRRFHTIPWIMKTASLIGFYLKAEEEQKESLVRGAILRYMSTSLIMTIIRVHRHSLFVDLSSLVQRGFLTAEEAEMIKLIPNTHAHPFVPICWALSLVADANRDELIFNSYGLAYIVDAINEYRNGLLQIILNDQLSYPLIYTQVNTLAVYTYFLFSLLSSQYTKQHNFDIYYFPFKAVIEFLVFVGLLKCAIGMLNPMGDDEENFELDEIILYNWMVCGCIDNSLVNRAPPRSEKDLHWDSDNVRLESTEKCRVNLNG